VSSSRRAYRLGCAATAVALAGPRIPLLLVWVFGHAVQTAFQSVVYPFVGVIFLPLTALAYALAADPLGSVNGAALAWPVLGFVADVAMLGLGLYWAVEYRLE
jgi:hypothetical protein